MSTTAASTNPPPHAPQASQTGARPAHLQGQRAQAPADLFAAPQHPRTREFLARFTA